MREIKFRAWDGQKFHYYTSLSGLYGVLNPIQQQFTGICGKISFSKIKIEHLHTLQNAVALCGQELEYKPKV